MAGTADADTATSVAADVRVDIPGWAIPVVEDPAAGGRAAAVTRVAVIPVAVTQAEVIRGVVIRAAVATHITKPSYEAKVLPASALPALGPLRERALQFRLP
jgi:hypothetical protein